MHTLIVVGSRRNGNSLKLAKILKIELSKNRIISNIIVPGNQKIYLCTGCMDCDTKKPGFHKKTFGERPHFPHFPR